MSESGGSESSGSESRSLLGRLLADDWVTQLFSLGLFVDFCLACIWSIKLLDLKTVEPLSAIGVGPAIALFFGYVLFSRTVAPGLHHVIQHLGWRWLQGKSDNAGVWADRVLNAALQEKDSGLLKLWERHKSWAARAKAGDAARWVLGLVVAANMIGGLFYPTFSASLYQFVTIDGWAAMLARVLLPVAFFGVAVRTWDTLIIDDRYSAVASDVTAVGCHERSAFASERVYQIAL